MSVVSTDQSNFLVMGAVGSSHEATTIPNTIKAVKGSGSSVERIMNGQPLQPMQQQQQRQSTGRGSDSSDSSSNQPLHWSQEEGLAPPSDWVALQCAGVCLLWVLACWGVLGCAGEHRPDWCCAARQSADAHSCQEWRLIPPRDGSAVDPAVTG